jgi:8-oxo-dGTP pyrophosphatase MutT (NUDIX family)
MHSDEIWQEFTHSGVPAKTAGRPAVLDNPDLGSGYFVGVAIVWIYRRVGNSIEILFQKRSNNVGRYSGFWDVSAGGHINLGETAINAAVRECKEEIGAEIDKNNIEFIVSDTCNVYKNMIRNFYAYDYTGKKEAFHFDDGEVDEVKWVPSADFISFIDEYAKLPLKSDREILNLVARFFRAKNGDNKS